MYDQLTPAALGCYGNRVTRAPHIDRLAADGVVFDAAYSNSPLCTPARYCMMTGSCRRHARLRQRRRPAEHRSRPSRTTRAARRLPHRARRQDALRRPRPAARLRGAADDRHLPGRLRLDAGLARAGRAHRLVVPQHGLGDRRRRRRGHQPAGVRRRGRLPGDRARCTTLPAPTTARPFLLVVASPTRTTRTSPASATGTCYEGRDDPAAGGRRRPTCRSTRTPRGCATSAPWTTYDHHRRGRARARRAYYANISYVDDWTGRLLGTLEALGLRDDTVVVLLADHGDMLGERGLWYKMNFFEGSARVPLIVHAPEAVRARAASRRRCRWSTCCRRSSTSPAAPRPTPSNRSPAPSLLPLCEGGRAGERDRHRRVPGRRRLAPIVMIRRGDLKFVHCPADPDQLYDLAADPHERVNLATDPAWASTVDAFRAVVAARWDLPRFHADVLQDQARRRFVTQRAPHRQAHAVGVHPATRRLGRVHAQSPRPERGRTQRTLAALSGPCGQKKGGDSPVPALARHSIPGVGLVSSTRHFSRDPAAQPHFESPQFRQVMQPSIMTTAAVLHFAHNCAPSGKCDFGERILLLLLRLELRALLLDQLLLVLIQSRACAAGRSSAGASRSRSRARR